jgi:ankyrin repeat protein
LDEIQPELGLATSEHPKDRQPNMARFRDDARQEAFLAAVEDGDLEAVQRYFELPDVLANVASWNAVHRAERLGEPGPHAHERPWYFGMRRGQNLFASSIIYGGQAEVFRWFFAQEQLALLGETLRAVAKHILRACLFEENLTPAREMVEILVESPLFQEAMGEGEQLIALGLTLNDAVSRGYDDWAALLLAYGADPNRKCEYDTPLTAMAYQGTTKTLDMLLAHGARMEGDTLLTQRPFDRAVGLVRAMVRRGADANDLVVKTQSSPLHEAAAYCVGKIARTLIKDGFADVDARDRHGATPLLAVLSGTDSRRGDMSIDAMAEMLLDAGANIEAVDQDQRGVLHRAVSLWDPKCLSLLLERGADPNARDRCGETPMALLLVQSRGALLDHVSAILTLLLQAGADPFICDASGSSVAQILESSESGCAYMDENPKLFCRDPEGRATLREAMLSRKRPRLL